MVHGIQIKVFCLKLFMNITVKIPCPKHKDLLGGRVLESYHCIYEELCNYVIIM